MSCNFSLSYILPVLYAYTQTVKNKNVAYNPSKKKKYVAHKLYIRPLQNELAL